MVCIAHIPLQDHEQKANPWEPLASLPPHKSAVAEARTWRGHLMQSSHRLASQPPWCLQPGCIEELSQSAFLSWKSDLKYGNYKSVTGTGLERSIFTFVCGTTVVITISQAWNLRIANPSSNSHSCRHNTYGPSWLLGFLPVGTSRLALSSTWDCWVLEMWLVYVLKW